VNDAYCLNCGYREVDRTIEKQCTDCKKVKSLVEFNKKSASRDGRQSLCRLCQRDRMRRLRNDLPRYEKDPQLRQKRCTQCNQLRPVSRFGTNRRSRDGYNYACKDCLGITKTRRSTPFDRRAYRIEKDTQRRLLLLRAGMKDIIAKDWRRILNSPCANCGTMDNLQVDHIIPLTRGGTHSVGNLQSLCRSCNTTKRNRLSVEWKYGKKSTHSVRFA
jgi:5-methylcytosine-specific restriction endonuclease McrA